jgi:signal transduction histidine kinase
MGRSSIYTRSPVRVASPLAHRLPMQDSREIDYFGQRVLQIVQPLAAGGDRREVLSLLAQSVANNFAADGCWILQCVSPDVIRVAASACVSHRTSSISAQIHTFPLPTAPNPVQWRMPLLPDYQVMVVENRDREQVIGYTVVATKGVEWYRETKLIYQLVADYISVGLIEEDLHVQAQISQIYPQLHYRLTQAIVENQQIDRLFEIAVADMVEALQLKRGLVLTLKSTDVPQPATAPTPSPATEIDPNAELPLEVSEWERPSVPQPPSDPSIGTPAQPEVVAAAATPAATPQTELSQTKTVTQVQIVTTIDVRKGDLQPLPASFLLENSHLCQTALANAPNPTIFDGTARQSTEIDRSIFQADRLPSIAMIPLMGTLGAKRTNGAVWGWLVLQDDRSRPWHPVELKLLQCQILQIALARIQRKALKQARTAVANRTNQVETSLQLQAKLHDVGRKHMEKLRQANDLKDEFISTIGHELRTPLTSMSLAIKMLRQLDVDPARRIQYLDILEEQCQREIKLVNDLLKLQQLESRQVELRSQQISLNQFISQQATIVTDRWPDSKSLEIALHLPQLSSHIETDADSLKHILEELLVNAGKFAMPQSLVDVVLTVEPEQAIIQVTNLSKPIATADLPYLFDRFRRGTGTTQQAIAGTGLGLALVRSMVDHIQGTITVTSEVVEPTIATTCFTVTIPTVLERQ